MFEIVRCFGQVKESKLKRINNKNDLINYFNKKFKSGWIIVSFEGDSDHSAFIYRSNGYMSYWSKDDRILYITDNGEKRTEQFSKDFNDVVKELDLSQEEKSFVHQTIDNAVRDSLNGIDSIMTMRSEIANSRLNRDARERIIQFLENQDGIISSMNPTKSIAGIIIKED